jgi:hypothetical protein
LKSSIDLPSVSWIDWPSVAPPTLISQTRQTPTDFIEQTRIEILGRDGVAPFHLWDGQRQALATMEAAQLAVFLKARQLGITWIACGYALWSLLDRSNQTVLAYSQGQLEANELIRRVSFLYHQHKQKDQLPALTTDNIGALGWSNGSRMLSLAATRKAGRSFTANIAILDEWAFMAWPRQTLAAVKPTIDAGGKLFIISSADGMGSTYHRFWQQASSGENGYTAVFLPWFAHPERGPAWRDQRLVESAGDTASVLREYPANDLEAFTAATDTIFDVWSDGPADGNVTEAAEYEAGAGPIIWGCDDGYTGKIDSATGHYTAESHPRVFGLYQLRGDGRICRFAEDYAAGLLSEQHIDRVLSLPYPTPDFAVVDKSAAELKARLHGRAIYTRNSPADVEESIKEMRRAIAPDANGYRRLIVHPRCKHFRYEIAVYRRDVNEKIVKAHDHGVDEARYTCWALRYDGV